MAKGVNVESEQSGPAAEERGKEGRGGKDRAVRGSVYRPPVVTTGTYRQTLMHADSAQWMLE